MGARFNLAGLSLLVVVAVWGACAPSGASVHSFTIIQLNDVYEIFPLPTRVADKYEQRGGLAYVATLIREAKQRGPVLVLHAGDFLTPSLLSIKFKHKGTQMIDAMNLIGIDVVTFGNNEFDVGCGALADRIRQSTFGWVSANVQLPAEMNLPEGKILPYRMFTVAGLRVGVFGLTRLRAPVNCDSGQITFSSPTDAASSAVKALERERAEVIVALTHQTMAEDRALASAVPSIDLIAGGHDHHPMADQVGKTLIAKAGANATALGLTRVLATRAGDRLVVEKSWTHQDVNPVSIVPDAPVSKALAPYAAEMDSLSRTIGSTEIPLDLREEVVRGGESNFGSYLADLIRAETHADVAIINGGALRGDRVVPAGPLTLKDLDTALVFDDRVVALRVSGKQLLQALENGVSLVEESDGRFLQASGLSFAFDPGRPADRRILWIRIGNRPLEPERIYTMAATAFLATPENVDGYRLPATNLAVRGDLKEMVLRDLARGPINPSVDGRIVSLFQPR
jgi:2',3'-cyclic-nucleotide 2'-phosphodiesterase (5'-nucleotidase family)